MEDCQWKPFGEKNELDHNLNSDKNISNYRYLFSAG